MFHRISHLSIQTIFKFGGRFKRVALIGQMLHPGTLVARLDAENGFTMAEPEECEQPFVEWTEIVPKPSTILASFANVVQVKYSCCHLFL